MVEVLLCSDLCSHRSLWRFTERLTGQQPITNGNQRRGWLPSVGFSLYPSLKYILFFFSLPLSFLSCSHPPSLPPSTSPSLFPPSLPPSLSPFSITPSFPLPLTPSLLPPSLAFSTTPSFPLSPPSFCFSLLLFLPLSFPPSLSAPQRYDPGFNYDSEPEELNNRSVNT